MGGAPSPQCMVNECGDWRSVWVTNQYLGHCICLIWITPIERRRIGKGLYPLSFLRNALIFKFEDYTVQVLEIWITISENKEIPLYYMSPTWDVMEDIESK